MKKKRDIVIALWKNEAEKVEVPVYRYGFNGKEKDEGGEWGSITTYDYGFRIYNPGIGRFLSVDPLRKGYPELTPYQYASNRPIDGIDLDGMEWNRSITSDAEIDAAQLLATTSGKIIEGIVNTVQWGVASLYPNEVYEGIVRSRAEAQGLDIPASFSMLEVRNLYDLRWSINSGYEVSLKGGLLEEGFETVVDVADIFGFSGGGAGASSLAAKIPFSKFSDLAREALLFRKKLGLNTFSGAKHAGSKSNVAVVEYLDEAGELRQMPFIADATGHAEKQIVDFVKNNQIDPTKVTRVYTELSPCTSCGNELKELPNATIDYSFDLGSELSKWKSKVDDLYKYLLKQNKDSN